MKTPDSIHIPLPELLAGDNQQSSADLPPGTSISEALQLLGKQDFLLAVHDASFPGIAGEDAGRGSPYGSGGLALASFARGLGFTGLQLGPQGQTSLINPSPYDGTLFSRNLLSLDLKTLVDQGLLSRQTLETSCASNPCPEALRVSYHHIYAVYERVLDEVHHNFNTARENRDNSALALDKEIKDLQSARWLRDDALFDVLSREHGNLPWRLWPELDKVLPASPAGLEADCAKRRRDLESTHAPLIERYALAQTLLLRQHRAFRTSMQTLGLKIYGDVQVGFSQADCWSLQNLLLRNYFMGAPPSRTNMEGQPWSYQVLDPGQYLDAAGNPGAVLGFISERLGKMLGEFDGLRLDHPHGLVCPWVYRADDPDPFHAVQHGARLFSSPDLPDHPELRCHAIVHPDQLNRERPCYADDWVREISPQQEERYALIMDALMEQVLANGRLKADILCEVLSTEPLPLQRVRLRHGLGRFRVTQKADMDNPDDGYRGENAAAEDWIMVGNHDTPTIWRLAKAWQGEATGSKQAAYLARRLRLEDTASLEAILSNDPRRLAHAKMAELFVSPARHVMIFFADLFGLEETYNEPGSQSGENWTLRVPPDFAASYETGMRRGEVLNLHAVLALALRARPEFDCSELIARLESQAGWRIDETA